jgi:hypothetical protein
MRDSGQNSNRRHHAFPTGEGERAQLMPRRPEHPETMQDLGLRDGETRTRTGDTTIFSRYVLAAERREIPGNERFLRVGLAPLIFAICAGFHAFQGMARLPSPSWPRGCSGGEPEVGALARRPDPHGSEQRCRFGRGARSSSQPDVGSAAAETPAYRAKRATRGCRAARVAAAARQHACSAAGRLRLATAASKAGPQPLLVGLRTRSAASREGGALGAQKALGANEP